MEDKIEYAINRFTMEAKRQLDVLNKELANKKYLAGDASRQAPPGAGGIRADATREAGANDANSAAQLAR